VCFVGPFAVGGRACMTDLRPHFAKRSR
jgi:hypothetical protein